jgi:hypothetical protein
MRAVEAHVVLALKIESWFATLRQRPYMDSRTVRVKLDRVHLEISE